MAFGVTEPNAGTDTSRIQTRAVKQGDRWIVNGRKVWTTNAQHATKILLLARTARPRPGQAAQGHDALLHRRSTARRSRVRVIDKLGPGRRRLQRDLHRRTSRSPTADVVGDVGRRLLPPARLAQPRAHRDRHRGGRHRARRARPRGPVRQGARRLRPADREEPGHRPPAGARDGRARGGRADVPQGGVALRPRPALRRARPTPPSCSRPRPGFNACDAALQTFGGFGYAKEFYVERLWREVRLYKIAPVSQQMALNYLAEHVLGLPRSY